MTVFTIYALFGKGQTTSFCDGWSQNELLDVSPGDDLRVLIDANDIGLYDFFGILTAIAFFLFCAEWLLQCYAKPGYGHCDIQLDTSSMYNFWKKSKISVGSFYFYLDLIATVSLVSDIPWMQGAASAEMQDLDFDAIYESLSGGESPCPALPHALPNCCPLATFAPYSFFAQTPPCSS